MTTFNNLPNITQPSFSHPQGTESLEGYPPNITKSYKVPRSCSFLRSPLSGTNPSLGNVSFQNRNRYLTEAESKAADSSKAGRHYPPAADDIELTDDDDDENSIDQDGNNVIEGAARSKVSRSSVTELMGLSGGSKLTGALLLRSQMMVAYLLFIIFLNSFRIATA